MDAVSSLGGVDLRPDEWGIDVVVSGSQKALMTPPGLAFAGVSGRAWELASGPTLPRFYLGLGNGPAAQAADDTAFTPPVSLVFGLREALSI